MRLVFFVLVVALPVAACTDAVPMKNSQNGQIAKCGPYAADWFAGGDSQTQREAECIRDFQRQGYERMP